MVDAKHWSFIVAALIVSLALIAVAWVLHVVWWRFRLPRHPIEALLLVFAVTPLVMAGIWIASGSPTLVSMSELPGIMAFYLGAAGCYLITYTGVEQTSPSLVIIRALEAAGEKGCSKEELSAVITGESFIRPRLAALKRAGMLISASGGFVLTSRGRRAAQFALIFSRVFNIGESA